jgi:hypothetical protein
VGNFKSVLLHIAACHLENLAEARDTEGGEDFSDADIVEALMCEGARDWKGYGLSPRSARRVSRDAAMRAVWALLQLPEWERYQLAHPGREYPAGRIRYCTSHEIRVRQLESALQK